MSEMETKTEISQLKTRVDELIDENQKQRKDIEGWKIGNAQLKRDVEILKLKHECIREAYNDLLEKVMEKI